MKNPSDLYSFIDNISNGIDEYEEERKMLKYKMHKYIDGNSSERVLKYFDLID
ncbi:TPA: CDP-glycerol glycerophosphotransferase family protein [Streptococcus suis]